MRERRADGRVPRRSAERREARESARLPRTKEESYLEHIRCPSLCVSCGPRDRTYTPRTLDFRRRAQRDRLRGLYVQPVLQAVHPRSYVVSISIHTHICTAWTHIAASVTFSTTFARVFCRAR
jgi:hypothetical protein